MIRIKARYRDRRLELDRPLALREGTLVEIDVRPSEDADDAERREWAEIGTDRLEQVWDNPADAIYDDWKRLYGV